MLKLNGSKNLLGVRLSWQLNLTPKGVVVDADIRRKPKRKRK